MSGFQLGEHIRATIDARVVAVGAEGHDNDVTPTVQVVAHDAGGAEYFVTLPAEWTSVQFERTAPPEWPPRAGDLWRDRHGSVWFAVDVHDIDKTDKPEIVMVLAYEDYRKAADQLNQRNGPMTLVHREDDTDQFGCDAVSTAGHAEGCPLGGEMAS